MCACGVKDISCQGPMDSHKFMVTLTDSVGHKTINAESMDETGNCKGRWFSDICDEIKGGAVRISMMNFVFMHTLLTMNEFSH